MKLMRLAPALSALALLAGSSAFADQVKFRYDVFNGAPSITNSAVLETGACGATVLNQPAVLETGACGALLTQPAVIDTRFDPYEALWQQATLDTEGRWGHVCGLPNVCETAPVVSDAVTLGAVIDNGRGDKMVQPAIVNGRCDDVFTSPIGGRTFSAPLGNNCGLMTQSAIIDDGPSPVPASLPPIHIMAQPVVIDSGCGVCP